MFNPLNQKRQQMLAQHDDAIKESSRLYKEEEKKANVTKASLRYQKSQ